ncbi:hypothetical protein BJY04DRAFT_28214 [Aspergillus karnatakaensis]|uniref:uncharacterized protein n=1 Tax=Aspergillus karnatakaensis TaxID=1810916 RepID=UPI003CCD80E6
MARSSALWLAYLILGVVLPQASAWTLLWRNSSIPSQIEDGQSAQNCTQIWHQEDEQFSFDPEGPWCLDFFSDANCLKSNGKTCEPWIWRKVADQNISAFRIYPMPPASVTAWGLDTTSSTPTPTSTETPTPTNANAEITPTPETESDDANGLSRGAIGGIVIGVVVAVALLCAAFFYLGHRTGKKPVSHAAAAATATAKHGPPPTPPSNTPPPPQHPTITASYSTSPATPRPTSPTSPMVYAPPPLAAELAKPPMVETSAPPYAPSVTYNQPPNGVRMVELPGQNPGAELSNSQQVQELEGRGTYRSEV